MWTTGKAILLLSAMPHNAMASLRGATTLARALYGEAVAISEAATTEEFPFPEFRYVPWLLIDTEDQNKAQQALLYNEATWNIPGTAPIEEMWWAGLDASQQRAATEIGFDVEGEEVWDCYQNHYSSTYNDVLYLSTMTHWRGVAGETHLTLLLLALCNRLRLGRAR